jgi:hypothetical protein
MLRFRILVAAVAVGYLPANSALADTVTLGNQTLALAPYSGGLNYFDSDPNPKTPSYDFSPLTDNPNDEQNTEKPIELEASSAQTAPKLPPASLLTILHQWLDY